MSTATERLIVAAVEGGRQVREARLEEAATTSDARRVESSLCIRCRAPLGREVFITIQVGTVEKHYHRRCVKAF